MNNKGWELPQMLASFGLLACCLVGVAIFIQMSFTKKEPVEAGPLSILKGKPEEIKEVEESDEDEENNYEILEDSMIESTKKYMKDHQEQQEDGVIIRLERLVKEGYMEPIIDPSNEETTCLGYVVYTQKDDSYQAFLRCPGSYRTKNYQVSYE